MGLFSLFRKNTFSHGIHPPIYKSQTSQVPIRRLPFPRKLVLPLGQHFGAPSEAIVHKGQEVVRGQPIARATGEMSVPIHAPASGIIKGIELVLTSRGFKEAAIIIEPYEASTQEVLWTEYSDPELMDRDQLLEAIKNTGLVGLGGAAFPAHFKKSVSFDKKVDTLIVNGSECEPFLTCDHRMMLEHPACLVRGIRFAMKATDTYKAIIGIEDNKMDAVHLLEQHLKGVDDITVKAVETKYPQGSEKMLIKSLLGREVPAGGLPADVGVIVNNVHTLTSLGRLIPSGEGLTERVITISGPGVKNPGNYWVPIGTTIGFIMNQVGHDGDIHEFIMGGPMMGPAVSSLDTPITKGCSGLLVLNEPLIQQESKKIWPCIKCGRCVQACPMHLNPSQLGLLAAAAEYEEMAENYSLKHCFECGCCSYVCPSNIPLVQYFRIAKAINREKAA